MNYAKIKVLGGCFSSCNNTMACHKQLCYIDFAFRLYQCSPEIGQCRFSGYMFWKHACPNNSVLCTNSLLPSHCHPFPPVCLCSISSMPPFLTPAWPYLHWGWWCPQAIFMQTYLLPAMTTVLHSGHVYDSCKVHYANGLHIPWHNVFTGTLVYWYSCLQHW